MGLTLKQLQQRQNMLTATDMVALAGASPSRSEMDVYVSKLAPLSTVEPEPPAPGTPADMGLRMEKFLARIYMDVRTPSDRKWRMYAPQQTFQHPEYPWAGATPDRFIFDTTDGELSADALKPMVLSGEASHLLECKLVGSFTAKDWDTREIWIPDSDRLPEAVYIQVQWQMFVTGYRRCDVAALLYGTRFQVFQIDYDPAFCDVLMQTAETFWNTHIIPRVPPPPDGSDAYQTWLSGRIGPPVGDTEVTAPPEAEQWALRYAAASRIEQAARSRKQKAAQYLQMHLGKYKKMRGPWGSATMVEKQGMLPVAAVCAEVGLKTSDFNYLQPDPSYHIRVYPSRITKSAVDDIEFETLVEMSGK